MTPSARPAQRAMRRSMPSGARESHARCAAPRARLNYQGLRDGRVMTTRILASALGGAVLALALSPLAAMAGDAKAGKALAERWCASCHVVSDDDQAAASDAAPSFKSIANRDATTEEGLKVYLADPHKDAMKGIVLPRLEIADLAAYIMSLKAP